MREMVDRFGDEIESEALDDEYFRMKVHVTVSHGFFSWLFQFAGDVEVLEPKMVRNKYLDMARKVLENSCH